MWKLTGQVLIFGAVALLLAATGSAATVTLPSNIAADYSTDVTAAIQSFIDASVANGDTLVFPARAYNRDTVGYRIDGRINIDNRTNITIDGGYGQSTGVRATFRALANRNTVLMIKGNSSGTTIKNMAVYGSTNKDTSTYDPDQMALWIAASSNTLVDNCYLGESWGDAVYINGGATNVTVQNSSLDYANRQGIAPCDANGVYIVNNAITVVGRYGIDIEPIGPSNWVRNVVIIGTSCWNCDLGAMSIGGGGHLTSLFMANDTMLKVTTDNIAQRHGPIAFVNSHSNTAGGVFTWKSADGIVMAGNSLPRNNCYLADCDGAGKLGIFADNYAPGATGICNSDPTPSYEYNNVTTTDPNWVSSTTWTELSIPHTYGVSFPYTGGGMTYVIIRCTSDTNAVTYNGLTSTDDMAEVQVNSGGALVAGYRIGHGGVASYNGTTLQPVIVPGAPTLLTATAVSATQINLAWTDNATSEQGFKIERSPDGSSNWTVIHTNGVDQTTYSDTGLSSNTTYYYRVRAYADSVYSSYSNTANATTYTATAPAAPTNLTAYVSGSTKIDLTWTDNSNDEDNFYVEQSPNGSSNWNQVQTVGTNVTYAQITGLSASTTYYFRVRAHNIYGNSTYSNTANATTTAGGTLSESWTGSNGSAWPAQWTWTTFSGAGTVDIQSNRGRCKGGSALDGLAYINNATCVNSDQTVLFNQTSNTGTVGLIARYNSSSNTYYRAAIDNSGSNRIKVYKRVSGVDTLLANVAITSVAINTDRMIRFYVYQNGLSGTILRAKSWQSGTTEPAWQIDITDGDANLQYYVGRVGIRNISNGTTTKLYDNYTATLEP